MGGVLQQGRIAQSPRWQCCGGPNPVAQRACQSRSSESGRCTGRRCIIIMMPWNVSPDTVMHSASAPCAPRCAAGGAQYQRRVAREPGARWCKCCAVAARLRASPKNGCAGRSRCRFCESAGGLLTPSAGPPSDAAAVFTAARGAQGHKLCTPPMLTSLEEGAVES